MYMYMHYVGLIMEQLSTCINKKLYLRPENDLITNVQK